MYFRKRKLGGDPSAYKCFSSIELAMNDTSSFLEKEVLEGELKSLGTITTVMLPTKILKKENNEKVCDVNDEEEEDFP